MFSPDADPVTPEEPIPIAANPPRLKKYLARVLPVGVGLLLLSWLLSQVDMREAARLVRQIPPLLLLFGMGSYLAGFLLRAFRFRLLLGREQPLRHLVPIVFVHYAALNIIPARLGELSYIILLKQVNQVSTGRSVSNLLVARVFDHLTISLLFLISTAFLDFSSGWLNALMLVVSAVLLATCALLALLFACKTRYVEWFHAVVGFLKLERFRLAQKIERELGEVVNALATLQFGANLIAVLAVSCGIWLCIFATNYFLLHAFQVRLSYQEIVFTSTCIIMMRLLPLQLVSGFGIHETTWVFLAEALNVPRQIAITAAFGSHIIATLFLLGFGLYGLTRIYALLDFSFIRSRRHEHDPNRLRN